MHLNITKPVPALLFLAGLFLSIASNSFAEEPKTKKNYQIYDKKLNLHNVDIPELSKPKDSERIGNFKPKSRIHVPNPNTMPSFRPNNKKKPEKKNKRKNWILPPMADDLKDKYGETTKAEDEDEEGSGWGWLHDKVNQSKKSTEAKKEKEEKENEQDDEDEFRLGGDLKTNFEGLFNSYTENISSKETKSIDEQELEARLNSASLLSDADVEKLKKDFAIEGANARNDKVGADDRSKWSASRDWIRRETEAPNYTMKETDSILNRWRSDKTTTILQNNDRTHTHQSSVLAGTKLSSGSQNMLNKYFNHTENQTVAQTNPYKSPAPTTFIKPNTDFSPGSLFKDNTAGSSSPLTSGFNDSLIRPATTTGFNFNRSVLPAPRAATKPIRKIEPIKPFSDNLDF